MFAPYLSSSCSLPALTLPSEVHGDLRLGDEETLTQIPNQPLSTETFYWEDINSHNDCFEDIFLQPPSPQSSLPALPWMEECFQEFEVTSTECPAERSQHTQVTPRHNRPTTDERGTHPLQVKGNSKENPIDLTSEDDCASVRRHVRVQRTRYIRRSEDYIDFTRDEGLWKQLDDARQRLKDQHKLRRGERQKLMKDVDDLSAILGISPEGGDTGGLLLGDDVSLSIQITEGVQSY